MAKSGNLWGLAVLAVDHQLEKLNENPKTAYIALMFAADAPAFQAAVATIVISAKDSGIVNLIPTDDTIHPAKKA